MVVTDCMHLMLVVPDGFNLFIDRSYLIFLLDSLVVDPDLSLSSTQKLLRWAVYLRMYKYTCMHIKGTNIEGADDMGRRSKLPITKRIAGILKLPSSESQN